MEELKVAMTAAADAVEAELDRILSPEEAPEERLVQAMRHGALGGGKRLRPFLLMQTAGLFSVSPSSALRAAAAIELVHCYSLVHDDLPAMDDDDLRRGQPTVHKAFDEATAILAGDALLTLAFEVLAHPDTHGNPEVRCALVRALAKAAGGHGMVGGQMIDLAAADMTLDIGAVTRLQRLKTGRLFDFSCLAGAILGKASDKQREALRGYTHDLGLAFQIVDDLLDIEGDAIETGKAVGKVVERGAGGQIGLFVEQRGDQLGQFQPAAQRRDRGRQPVHRAAFAQIGQQRKLRQQPGRTGIVDLADAAGHAAGVDHQLHPRQRLRRLALHPGGQPVDQRAGEIDPGRQGEDAGGVAAVKHRSFPPAGFRRGLSPPGGPRRTSGRDIPVRRGGRVAASGSRRD